MAKISVVIPAYNAQDTIVRCLDSIFETTFEDVEVIVVDDASSDGTAALLQKYPCRVIRLPRNSGASAARNAGARMAQGEILYFVDADIIQKTDNLSLLQKVLDEDPHARIINVTPHWGSMERRFGPEFIGLKYHHDYDVARRKNIRRYPVTWVTALGCFMPREVFLQAGGFDENFHLGGEEYDLGRRLMARGHRIDVVLDMEVYHAWWGLTERARLNYTRSRLWLSTFFKRRAFEAMGGVATRKNAVNTFLVTAIWGFLVVSCFTPLIVVPMILLVLYCVYNGDLFLFIYRKKKSMGFVLLSMLADLVLYLPIAAGIVAGTCQQMVRPRRVRS